MTAVPPAWKDQSGMVGPWNGLLESGGESLRSFFTPPLGFREQRGGVNQWVVSGGRVGEFFRETFGVRTRTWGLRSDPE
jgi:hypothetical protein